MPFDCSTVFRASPFRLLYGACRRATRRVRAPSGAAVALLATATGAAVLLSAAGDEGTAGPSLSPVSSSPAMKAEHTDEHLEARNQVALKVSAAQTRVEQTRRLPGIVNGVP